MDNSEKKYASRLESPGGVRVTEVPVELARDVKAAWMFAWQTPALRPVMINTVGLCAAMVLFVFVPLASPGPMFESGHVPQTMTVGDLSHVRIGWILAWASVTAAFGVVFWTVFRLARSVVSLWLERPADGPLRRGTAVEEAR